MKNIEYVVALVQQDLDDYTTRNRDKYIQYGINAVRDELHFRLSDTIKVAYLDPNVANVAPMPADYEYYTKVAVNIGGKLITLSVNKDMTPVAEFDSCGELVEQSIAQFTEPLEDWFAGGYWFAPHFRAGNYVGEMYGYGAGFNEAGYFKEDKTQRVFNFYRLPRTQIILEYKSSGDFCASTVIPTTAVAFLRACIHNQLAEHGRGVTAMTKQEKMNKYMFEKERYKDQHFSFTLSDWMDWSYTQYQSSPKR